MIASASLVLGVIALGPPALADRNPRVSSIDYVDCDDIRGWVLPRFTGCRGDGAKSIEATLVRCSDLKREVAATLSECVIETRGGGKSAGKGGTGNGNGNGGHNGGGDDGGDDNGGGGSGPSASASAGGSGSTATATSGSGPKASASAGPGGATGSASGGSGSVSTP